MLHFNLFSVELSELLDSLEDFRRECIPVYGSQSTVATWIVITAIHGNIKVIQITTPPSHENQE